MSAIDIAGITRSDGRLRAYGLALDRARRLEQEAAATFAQLHAATEGLAEEGVVAEIELESGMAAAYAEWKQRRRNATGPPA